MLLLLPGMTTQPISFMDALFTATSAAAVTGLSVVTTSTAFTRLGQWVILLLMQLGGLGFVVIVVLTLRLLGRRISLLDRLAVSSSLGLASPGAVMRILVRTVAVMLVLEGIGTADPLAALEQYWGSRRWRRRVLRRCFMPWRLSATPALTCSRGCRSIRTASLPIQSRF